MDKKFCSIITVVLNTKEDLIETINSLRKQEFKSFEYIVIDGDSTDGTKKILEEEDKKNCYYTKIKSNHVYWIHSIQFDLQS